MAIKYTYEQVKDMIEKDGSTKLVVNYFKYAYGCTKKEYLKGNKTAVTK